MTREDIAKAEKDSGLADWWESGNDDKQEFNLCLTCFAAIVVAADRKLLKDEQQKRGQKPVAYVTGFSPGYYAVVEPTNLNSIMPVGMALYRAPQQRKPLTDEKITRLWVEAEPGPEAFARAIEQAHGIGDEE